MILIEWEMYFMTVHEFGNDYSTLQKNKKKLNLKICNNHFTRDGLMFCTSQPDNSYLKNIILSNQVFKKFRYIILLFPPESSALFGYASMLYNYETSSI